MKQLVLQVFPIAQPAGCFYLTKARVGQLKGCVNFNKEEDTKTEYDSISSRASSDDGTGLGDSLDVAILTPICISVYESVVSEYSDGIITLRFETKFGDVIDEGARLDALFSLAKYDSCELPIYLFFGATNEINAHLFSILENGRNDTELISVYERFDISKGRSPQRTAYEIAGALNRMESSPLMNKLQLFGAIRSDDDSWMLLPMGVVSERILSLISNNPEQDLQDCNNKVPLRLDNQLPFRNYYIQEKDEVILRIILNCFQAVQVVLDKEKNSVLNRLMWGIEGVNAVLDSLKTLVPRGIEGKDLSVSFFEGVFSKAWEPISFEDLCFIGDEYKGKELTQVLIKIILEGPAIIERANQETHDPHMRTVTNRKKRVTPDSRRALQIGSNETLDIINLRIANAMSLYAEEYGLTLEKEITKTISDAERIMADVLKMDPKSAVAHNDLGVIKYWLGKYEDALSEFDKAIQLNPDFKYAKTNKVALSQESARKKALADFGVAIKGINGSKKILFLDYEELKNSALHIAESELLEFSQKIKSYSIPGSEEKDSLLKDIVFYPLIKDKHSAQIVVDQKTVSESNSKEKVGAKKNKGKL